MYMYMYALHTTGTCLIIPNDTVCRETCKHLSHNNEIF